MSFAATDACMSLTIEMDSIASAEANHGEDSRKHDAPLLSAGDERAFVRGGAALSDPPGAVFARFRVAPKRWPIAMICKRPRRRCVARPRLEDPPGCPNLCGE